MKEKEYQGEVSLLVKELKTNIDSGLNEKEVLLREERYGKNSLPKKKTESVFKIFFSGILDPIVLLLLATVLISAFIGEYIDATVIFFIVLLDLILGTIEEYQANKNADSLKNLIKYDARVIRNNEEKIIDSENLVPGDIVLLNSGDHISADMRIIECINLQVDESILTGESTSVIKNNLPIEKDVILAERHNMLFAGCSIFTGRCKALVVKTGINTIIGNIAQTISTIKEEKSPLAIRMERLSKQMTLMIIIFAIIIAFTLYLKGMPSDEIFMSVVALSVSAMPEGLPLALTMALTITSNLMIKKNVIVKKLKYVESLGSCTVIATDKTGTLTVNEQTAKKIVLPNNNQYLISGTGYNLDGNILKLDMANREHVNKLLLHGKLNNEAGFNKKKYYGDSIDIAFLVLANKENIYSDEYQIIKRIPYESENKYSAVFYKYHNEMYCTVKGSMEVIMSFCNKMMVNNKEISLDRTLLMKQNEELSRDGYRVICVASGKVNKFVMKDYYDEKDIPKLCMEGMVGFIDPIRKEVLNSINDCYDAGIKVLMITGDHPLTAFSIAKEINLVNSLDDVTTGEELAKYQSDNEFDYFIKNKKVFARVTPMDKLRIVESLKRSGEFVAVTGDGVNDAPAIRSANIGISMGSGTDTAKETSQMVIVDDNFKSIVSGIELGRCAYANIRKVCFFLLSCGLAEVLFYLLSIIFNLPMPLVAIQLLWLNLVTDGFQDIALSFEKVEKGIMKRPPIDPNESIFNKELLYEIMYSGMFIGIIVFIVWYILIHEVKMDISPARGYVMFLMVLIQNIHVFNCRSEKKSAFSIPLHNNPLVLFTVIGAIGLQVLASEIPFFANFLKVKPVPYEHIFILLAFALLILLAMEVYKFVKNIKNN